MKDGTSTGLMWGLMMPIVPFYGLSVDKFVQKLWLVMNN